MKKWLKRLIDKIAEANKESFSSTERLDCCNANNHNRPKK